MKRGVCLVVGMIGWCTFVLPGCDSPEVQPTSMPTTKRSVENESDVLNSRPMGIIGQIEPVVMLPERIVYDARIDTGATTSSLDAKNLQLFERDGKRWVRFDLVDPTTQKTVQFERAVVRIVRIIQHGREALRRPVVKLMISMGPIILEREFTLADRADFKFPILIGRNVLRNQAIVDVARTRTLTPEIKNGKTRNR